ncbi:MAG: glycoside hydrolase family 9 protein [Candidatus Marinimicrobia bacterium]|nr:glycoside hydrolase family 9 protein [Candidatus Neomarinimicrobiota bacterium]
MVVFRNIKLILSGLFFIGVSNSQVLLDSIYFRLNQIGYLPEEPKQVIVFSNTLLENRNFYLIEVTTGDEILGPYRVGGSIGQHDKFNFHHLLDFTRLTKTGRYKIRIDGASQKSLPFTIGSSIYASAHEICLSYIRQQRCGYNPFFDKYCHQQDGKTMYGPMPDSTHIDVTGGWHDAGDHLRYLLTSGNTVCRLLLAYRENKLIFTDQVNNLGQEGSNGIPDILDEAKWGLDWMLKMHQEPEQLFHQVADDRDHIGFKLPFADSADYGWGPGSFRVVYYATGQPQGLGKYQNTSTGIANLAGRYAAAMAMAYTIWQDDLNQPVFAQRCLQAGKEVFNMGLQQTGCQEGTPSRAPYRYHEITWADDMEWGAAELYRVTGEPHFLDAAKRYAIQAGPDPWMGADSARHYEFYPFMNMGHYALFDQVDPAFQDTLIEFYRIGIERVAERASNFAYGIGIPFIWCSNNLVAAFVNQCLLYEKMSGDETYHQLVLNHRDWLLGRNPWGVSQFVGIPAEGGVTPQYPHTAVTIEWDQPINGGLNDGPVYTKIYQSLKGIRLSRPDPYAAFQSDLVVYHDDIWDYSTNEPTLDGTAEALFFLTMFASPD